jgi:hypothetical protein
MVGDDSCSLAKQQSNRHVFNCEIETQRVIDDDQVRFVSLQLEQFHGVRFGDRFRIVVFLVFLGIEKQIANNIIDNGWLRYSKRQVITVLVEKRVDPRCLLLIEIRQFVYRRKSLVFRPFNSVLRLRMAFVTFKAKWKLEQLHILRALPLNSWAITLITSDVHAEQALDCCNGSIWHSLNGSKAEFDFMLLLKGGLATHDTQK